MKQAVNNVNSFALKVVWEMQLPIRDLFKNFVIELTVEWNITDTKLVDNTTQSPQVGWWP